MEKMKLIIFLFLSVCQAPFISNKSVYCFEHSLADVKDKESMRWMLVFGYSLGASGAMWVLWRPTDTLMARAL